MDPVPARDNLLVLDSRRRGSLWKFGKHEHTLYSCETMPDGTIMMTPVRIEKIHS